MNDLKSSSRFMLPLDVIELRDEEAALLKGGKDDNVLSNSGCDCNCGSKCNGDAMPDFYTSHYIKPKSV